MGEAVIPDLDIFRSANVLVKQHGEDAPIQAAKFLTPGRSRRIAAGMISC